MYDTLLKEREGMIEVKGRRGKRGKQPLNDVKETTGFWKPKAEAMRRTLCKTRFGRCYVPAVKQATGRIVFRFPVFRCLGKFHDAIYIFPPVIRTAPTSPFTV